MASVKAAASLFDSDDAEDPFASLGTEPAASSEAQSPETGHIASKESVDDSASFFDVPVNGGTGAQVAGHDGAEHQYNHTAPSYSYAPQAYDGGYQKNYSHPTNVHQTSGAHNSVQYSEAHETRPSYDSYAPTSTSNNAPATQQAHTSSYTPSQYNYAPQPTVTQSPYNYAPSAPAHNVSAYTPSASSFPTQSSVPVVPKPMTQRQTLTRPKVSNAYDPPFPIVPARRAVSQGRSQPAYNPYKPASPPPPLPPAPAPPRANAPPNTYSNFATAHNQPPRPPSTSIQSGYAPPRPPSSSSGYSTHAPPRPPSSTSGFTQSPYSHPQRPPSSASSYNAQQYPGRPPSSASNYSAAQYHTAPPRPPSTASNFSAQYSHPPRPPSSSATHYDHTTTPPPPVPKYVPQSVGSNGDSYLSHPPSESNLEASESSDAFDPEAGGDWEMDRTVTNSRTLTPPLAGHPDLSMVEEVSLVQGDEATHFAEESVSNGTGYPSSAYPYQVPANGHDNKFTSQSHSEDPQLSPVVSSIGHYSTESSPSVAAYQTTSSATDSPPTLPSGRSVSHAPPPPPLAHTSSYSYRPSSSASMGRSTSPLSGQPATSSRFRPSSAASVRTSPPGYPAPPVADPYAPRRQTSTGQTVENVYNMGYVTKPPLQPASNPYMPGNAPPPQGEETRGRSLSNGSTFSMKSTASEDRYAPTQYGRQTSEADYGPYTSRYDFPNAETSLGPPQEVAAPARAPYAPSPSLMGTNDPLGRAGARVPVFSFGFGGKVVTCFHGASRMTAGFDVALSSRISTGVDIRILNKVIPESALETSVAFPGPLFGDGGSSPTIGLVRPGASTKTKDRRNKVITYLNERIVEIHQGIGYLHNGSVDKRRADGKLVLVKLLKIMVENEGRLSGSPEIDKAVRSALVPHLDDLPDDPNQGFIPLQRVGSLTGLPAMNNSDVIATTTLHASALDKIQNFLLRGQRKQAYHYALDQQLWAHAMVIASGIDKDSWQEVVREFIKTELGIKTDPARLSLQLPGEQLSSSVNGREGLRAAYGLFTGQGATSVQELVPQNLLAKATSSLVPPLPQVTPMTPNFPGASAAGNVPPEALENWAETVCMMLSTTITNELSATLLCLGDQLYSNHWVEAGHVCYLLSSQTLPNGNLPHPPIGGIGHPSARIVLAGSRNPQSFPIFYKDPDPLILTEIIEFALSLPALNKGQEPFAGLPHLQAYRFVRAVTLVELGYISETSRYCEAITTALARPSPYFNDTLLEQLKGLSDRLQGVAHSDKNSWIGGKLGKPSLDSIGGWLEGRFTKLVTGDVDSPGLPSEETAKPDGPGFSNTFSQYSTISSAAPSTSPSPQSSVVNLSLTAGGASLGSYRPPDRSSSAMDHRRKQTAPPPRIASANAATTSFSQAYSLGHALNNYQPMSTTSEANAPRMTVDEADDDDDPNAQVVTWWGDIDSHRTPTAANFMRADNVSLVPTGDGFMSPMGNIPFSPHPNAQRSFQSSNRVQEEDEEEDLGFGNSKPKAKEVPYDPGNLQTDVAPEKKVDQKTERPDAKPTGNASSESGGSWFGRWFKKSDTPAPVKASLGEETSFYYDKELKKWVNKKAGGAEAATPTPPPPPPSRPQTASPGMTGPRQTSSSNASVGPPPPARSASAMDLTSPPKRSVPRVRSNLAPTPEAESTSTSVTPPPPSTTPGLVPPPSPMPGRPKSSTSKRPIRNRYVDVFAQEGGGAA